MSYSYLSLGLDTPVVTEEQLYQTKILDILQRHPYIRTETGPTQLRDYLYIGNYDDAGDVEMLKKLKITHVLNCAAYKGMARNPYPEESGVDHYLQFHADDDPKYNMLCHFQEAREFIDSAVRTGGRVLVHCAMGINRSGVICAAYIMAHEKRKLLDTVRLLKDRRRVVLVNRGFQKCLVKFARDRGLLEETDDDF